MEEIDGWISLEDVMDDWLDDLLNDQHGRN